MTDSSPKALVARYAVANRGRAGWQLLTSVGLYLAMWAAMPWALTSWWLTVPFVLVGGGLLVRVFIVFHDCGHSSFYATAGANRFWGFVTGVLTMTPFEHWRAMHAIHHGTTGNLDKRGTGDVWTMTVNEYCSAPRSRRIAYRIVRNPLVLLLVAPLWMFLIDQRRTVKCANDRDRRSVWLCNAGLLVWSIGMSLWVGFVPFLLLQLAILAIAGAVGVWLFYTQHQFEAAYWQPNETWDFETAAIHGSSYLKLPRVLQWFTGNIGFHHIHHLNSRIPNYNLQECHDALTQLQTVRPLTLLRSLGTFRLKLWDESSGKLVRWRHVRKMRAA